MIGRNGDIGYKEFITPHNRSCMIVVTIGDEITGSVQAQADKVIDTINK